MSIPDARSGLVGAFVVGASRARAAQNPITRVSVDDAGVQGDRSISYWPRTSVSGDGRFVAFDSQATNLVSGRRGRDHDVSSTTGPADDHCMSVDSSSARHGVSRRRSRATAASSRSRARRQLVANDGNRHTDVFVRDRDPDGNGIFDEGNGVATIVTSTPPAAPRTATATSPRSRPTARPSRSRAWRRTSSPTTRTSYGRVRPRLATGTTVCASVDPYGDVDRQPDEGGSFGASLSADGKLVLFTSWAWNLTRTTPISRPTSTCGRRGGDDDARPRSLRNEANN